MRYNNIQRKNHEKRHAEIYPDLSPAHLCPDIFGMGRSFPDYHNHRPRADAPLAVLLPERFGPDGTLPTHRLLSQ